jgi:hypothetical protein
MISWVPFRRLQDFFNLPLGQIGHLFLRATFHYEKAGGGFLDKIILYAPGEEAPKAGFHIVPAPRTQMFVFF